MAFASLSTESTQTFPSFRLRGGLGLLRLDSFFTSFHLLESPAGNGQKTVRGRLSCLSARLSRNLRIGAAFDDEGGYLGRQGIHDGPDRVG